MKFFAVLALFLAPLLQAADYTNGQAARAVYGQYSFTRGDAIAGPQILGGVGQLALANGNLYVADSNRVGATPSNNRIMGFGTGFIPDPKADLAGRNIGTSLCNLCGFPANLVLGQPDYVTTGPGLNNTATTSNLNGATGVATDGHHFAVADTDNNRVLLWNNVPTGTDTPADIVLGQKDFTTRPVTSTVSATTLRGPQGVWIQNGKLFVADTQNHRILIWNSIPTANDQAADLVLGQPNLATANQPPVTTTSPTTAANQLLNPVSVTSDGTHVFVADLGFNRVLIWNSIPTQNTQNADVVVGQRYMTASTANNSPDVCPATGTNSSGQPTFPRLCEKTLNFPRYAISDGTKLYIADGGNDRVLIFNSIPTENAAGADHVLGQPDFASDVISSASISIISTVIDNTSSVDTIPAPQSLAVDGPNLYVSDPYNRRVLVFTPGDTSLPNKSVLNAASQVIRQEGVVALNLVSGGTVTANDTVTITIHGTAYVYTEKTGDTLALIGQGIVNVINASNSNAGDPNVYAEFQPSTFTVLLSSKQTGLDADTISLAATTSNTANVVATASGTFLTGGTAAVLSVGTVVQINGTNLSDTTQTIPSTSGTWSLKLGGVQVYMDGFPQAIYMVSPNQIVAQVPFDFNARTSSSVYVRTEHQDGTVTVTNATPIGLALANPGLFALSGSEPRVAYQAMHQAGNPSATVSIDGTITAGNTATITINGRAYTYTVASTDTTTTVAQALVKAINNANDADVTAALGGEFARVVITARQPGAAGSGITIAGTVSTSATLTVTAYQSATCCSDSGSGLITPQNPAQVNETITLLATGLGGLTDPSAQAAAVAGVPYNGPQPNNPTESVSATMGGSTAQVINAGLGTGMVGVYQVQMIVPAGLSSNQFTQVYIAQDAFISNIATIPVGTAVTAVTPTITASPNPISVLPGVLGQTTVSWTAAATTSVEVRLGSPTGPLFASGPGSGSAVTGAWVTDGLTFYLQDVTNGAASSSNTIATTTVNLQAVVGTLTASQNPIFVAPGSLGQATISWTAPSGTATEVHLGSPTGPLFASGSGGGSAVTGAWVTDGLTFYLQDVSNGPANAANTIATLVVHLEAATGTITASPNPIPVAAGTMGQTTVSWSVSPGTAVEVHVGSPTGPLFASGGTTGSAVTGQWVTDGLVFYLQDVTSSPASAANTLGTVTAHLQSQ